MEAENKTPVIIRPGSQDALARVQVRPRMIGAWIVSDQELESLRTASWVNATYFGLFGIALGAAISLITTLETVAITNVYAFTAFWGVFIITCFFTVLFLIMGIIQFLKTKHLVDKVKEESPNRASDFIDTIS